MGAAPRGGRSRLARKNRDHRTATHTGPPENPTQPKPTSLHGVVVRHLSAGRRPGRHNARRPAVLPPNRVLTSRVGVNGWVHTCEAHLRGRSRLPHPALRGNRVDPDTYRKVEEAGRC